MHIDLLVPHLIPAAEMRQALLDNLALPALATLLARGSHTMTDAPGGMDAVLYRRFGIARQADWPIAPITLLADGGNPAEHYWLRADPVHLRATRDQLMLVDSAAFNISQDEAEQFAEAFNRHFRQDGLLLYPLRPNRWYLKIDTPPTLTTHSVNSVAGKHIDAYLPGGPDALAWHRLYNEIQMLFFSLNVNDIREARGELPINSLWCWGGGVLPKTEAVACSKLYANDSDARALAFAAGVPNDKLPVNAAAIDQPAIILLDALTGGAQYGDYTGWREALLQLEHDWFAPLLAGLKSGRISSLQITTATQHRLVDWQIQRSNLLKFWRRDSLQQSLDMPA
ncbi:MAG: hypothetical protein P4L77_08330 [Sulfuriferula sp.]|nr:hypothetical protein [Sulfuriferula sp.]